MPSFVPRFAALVAVTTLLAGCARVLSEPQPCPPVVEYDHAFLERAAKELDLLPPDSAVVEMLEDYYIMRQQVRVCSVPAK